MDTEEGVVGMSDHIDQRVPDADNIELGNIKRGNIKLGHIRFGDIERSGSGFSTIGHVGQR